MSMPEVIIPDLSRYHEIIQQVNSIRISGRVVQVVGLTIEAVGLDCQIGEVCEIKTKETHSLLCEVVGFREKRVLLMPLGEMEGIQPGSPIYPLNTAVRAPVGTRLLGRVLDGLGQPIDGLGPLGTTESNPTYNAAPPPLTRKPITEPLVTGIRAIDGILTCAKGQRMGIFSDLGEAGLARSVVVVSTSDQPALVRLKAAWVATTIAERFRDMGLDVTLLMDSVTRFAMAQREVGLAIGEPPASKGYTPSVFALLPKLLERAGSGVRGTITGFFTVLVEGDDFNEPICDAARSILDGHIILSRALASRNHYPAIDVLNSVSRVMPSVTSHDHVEEAAQARKLLASYEKARDLINIGAYVNGSDPDIDAALVALPSLNAFLQQDMKLTTPFEETERMLAEISTIKVGNGA
jgi:flagellum-specific ATP synthase